MKLKLCYSLFIAIIFANVGCHRKQVPSFNFDLSKMVKSKNQDTCGTNLPFSSTLKVDTIQRLSDKGILFSIITRNTTDSQILISPPTKEIYIELRDKSGKDLLYPYYHKELFFNQGAYVNLSYTVTKIMVNRKKIDVDPYSNQKIPLPHKGEMETFYKIDRINQKVNTPTIVKSQLAILPAGDYILFLESFFFPSRGCLQILKLKCSIKYQNQQ